MDSTWLLLGVGGFAFYLWNRSSQRESPPDWAVAPEVEPVGEDSPITKDEWIHFNKVARAALEQAEAVPYIEKRRHEHGTFVPVIRRWNSDKLIRWQSEGPKRSGRPSRTYYPRGVSAHPDTQELYVWSGDAQFFEYRKALNRTGQRGPWNAELRGMMKKIEAISRRKF
jgi:hypothetical protein